MSSCHQRELKLEVEVDDEEEGEGDKADLTEIATFTAAARESEELGEALLSLQHRQQQEQQLSAIQFDSGRSLIVGDGGDSVRSPSPGVPQSQGLAASSVVLGDSLEKDLEIQVGVLEHRGQLLLQLLSYNKYYCSY